MIRHKFKRIEAEMIMVVVAFIWGTTFVVVKDALAFIDPFLFLGIRFLLAFLVLLGLTYGNMMKMRWSTVKVGCFLGLFLFIGYVFQTIGLKYTTSSNAGFITGMSVVLVPIIYALFNSKLPSLITTVTVLMAAIGLYLLTCGSSSLNLSYGDILELVCAVGFAFHIVLVDRYSYKHNAVAITGIQILFVGVLCMGIGVVTEPWPHYIGIATLNAILITSVFATSLAFLAQNYLQKFSTPTRFAVALTTEPVFAAVAGYLWAGDLLSKEGLVGAGLILLAMILSILLRRNQAPDVVDSIGQ